MKIETKYVAFDGFPFQTEAECRAYESKLSHVRLAGMTIEQVEAALNGSDPELADAIEQVGTRLARDRRERGDLKRQRAPKGHSAQVAEADDAASAPPSAISTGGERVNPDDDPEVS
jgi:hypothetical protein